MISNEERRKVAEQLRSIPSVDYFGHKSINPRHLWETIGFLRTVDGRIPTHEVEHLAALIDRPTCRNLAKPHGMSPVGAENWFECSECHCKAQMNKIGMPLRHCPHCGREVIE